MPATKKTADQSTSPKQRRLTRSTHDRMIAGVAAGIADYFDIDPSLIRIGFILITLLGGSGILAYLILWLVLPVEGSVTTDPDDQIRKNVEEIKEKANNFAHHSRRYNNRSVWGIFLVGLGVIFLLQNFGFASWFNWGKLWPLALIILGFIALTR